MAESAFARRMMAQKLMTDARPDPFSDSRFFAGKMRPSMADINQPTTMADARAPAATASLFAPGAGIADVMGYAPDPMQAGQMLPSFGANVRQGNYLDAGLQTLGVAGDVLQAGGAFVPPLAAVGTALKAPRAARVASRIKVTNTADVSDTFGEGAKSVTYTDPDSGGFIEVVQRKDGPTSVLGLEVPEQFRGSGIGQELQAAAMADNPMLQGQVSSKAAAVGAYRLGRRPVGKPDATLEEVFGMIDDQSSVLMRRPNPNEAAGAAMDAAQARYFETGKFEAPTAENPVSIVQPTETEPGIIAFHGSGADFDEFRLEMIGTGEGAQAYGYGLYFTDSEDIAKFYRDTVQFDQAMRGKSPIKYKGKIFEDLGDTAAAEAAPPSYNAIKSIAEEMNKLTGTFGKQTGPKASPAEAAKDRILSRIDADIERYSKAGQVDADLGTIELQGGGTLEELLLADLQQQKQAVLDINADDIEIATGKMYKVGLAPKPDELLDYDAPLSQQPRPVQKQIENLVGDLLAGEPETYNNLDTSGAFDFPALAAIKGDSKSNWMGQKSPPDGFSPTGDDILRDLKKFFESQDFQNELYGRGDRLASELMTQYGIPGIKYRAAGSRATSTADEAAERNYVIFDDKAVNIMEKYGIVGPVAVTAAGAAAVNRGRNDNDNGGSILPDAGIM
jgi:hypothetical protein